MEMYKLKHIPTGLYYVPRNHNNSQLSKKGKIYCDAGNILNNTLKNGKSEIELVVKKDSVLHLMTKDVLQYRQSDKNNERVFLITKVDDWTEEFLTAIKK